MFDARKLGGNYSASRDFFTYFVDTHIIYFVTACFSSLSFYKVAVLAYFLSSMRSCDKVANHYEAIHVSVLVMPTISLILGIGNSNNSGTAAVEQIHAV